MQNCDTLLIAPYILTQDEQRNCLQNHAIAIDNGFITALGSTEDIQKQWQAKNTVNLENCLLMPGLINTHTHVAMTFMRGIADDLPLMQWLNEHIFPTEKNLTREIIRLSSKLGFAEMLRSGTTACMDMYLAEEEVLHAADITGIRCQGGEAIFNFPTLASTGGEATLDLVRSYHEKYKSHSRLTISITPHAVYTTTPELLTKCAELAEELNLTVHIHLAETKAETAQCLEQWKKRPLQLCHDVGLLRNGTTLAHMVDINTEEINLLAEISQKNLISIAHNPSSNMKLASGIAPIEAMQKAGICTSLGTDGAASNNKLNMFTEMREASLLQKVHNLDPTALNAQNTLDMATINGGRIFSAPNKTFLGSLQVGYAADIIAISLQEPHMQPMYNPISHLVYAATGMEVTMSMVEGEILYQDNKYTRFDYADILKEINRIKDWVIKHKA